MRPRNLGGQATATHTTWRLRTNSWFARNPAWPLVIFLGAFPLWWLLGLGSIGFIIVGLLLGYQLLKQPSITVPPGFRLWFLFLVIVFLGVLVLWVPVPGLLPESGPSRVLSWAFRLIWLLSSTVVMLFIGNSSQKRLPDRTVIILLGMLFAVTVIGGYAGIFLSSFDFPSLLEVVLPQAIASNTFMNTQIHPGLAQVQDILGYSSPRPKAPFDYANTWGANYGLLLPFYLMSIKYFSKKWARGLLWMGLLVALPPAVLSLNRAMWLGLAVLAIIAVVRLTLSGHFAALAAVCISFITGAILLLSTPLWDIIESRLENPHSNTGRANLAGYTVQTTLEQSPLIGFGSTRTRQGNFFSIAAGATADCHQCNPPQLGTQGTLWFLIFCTGFLGTALFLAFFIKRFLPVFKTKNPEHWALLYPAVFFLCVLPTYDTITTSLFILMMVTGLSWRWFQEEHTANQLKERAFR
ncbi:Lipid A core - O-antigen ligase [Paeniglutamicibacter gangotriensis Lz1y]|uniref:Lipid A core-O-antigen ligase n=2 Tax=Paeniglutamicibacter gangotriensis TaxID=254787 RepID=M7MSK0_9MICC|nr:Lipid A core - O-antigen ligase [Paeniglutamicibacter gangotriensis Lz1y]